MKLPGACDGTGELNKMIIWYFNHTVSQWSVVPIKKLNWSTQMKVVNIDEVFFLY